MPYSGVPRPSRRSKAEREALLKDLDDDLDYRRKVSEMTGINFDDPSLTNAQRLHALDHLQLRDRGVRALVSGIKARREFDLLYDEYQANGGQWTSAGGSGIPRTQPAGTAGGGAPTP